MYSVDIWRLGSDLVTPHKKHQAPHSREWGTTITTSPEENTLRQHTSVCWGRVGAFEMLYEHQQ